MTAFCPEAAARRAVPSLGLSWPLLVAVVGYLISINNSVLIDPDTYWHLATANWMFEHLAIPAVDPFSYTKSGAPWVAHEWLAEVVLGGAYRFVGWAGVAVVTAAAYAAAMALLCRYLLRHLEPIYAISVTSLSGLLVQDHLLARPHALVLPVLVAWGIALIQARENGCAPRWHWAMLMAIWANLHGSFPLGIGLAVFFAAEATLAADAAQRLQVIRAWGGFVLFSLLAALLTPHGWHGLSFVANLNGMGYVLDNIGEWRSPDFHQFQPLEIGLLVAALAVLGRGVRLPVMRALLVLAFLHLALVHVRHVEIIGLLAPLAMAQSVGRQWEKNSAAGQSAALDEWFESLATPARPRTVVVTMALLAGIACLVARGDVLHPAVANTPEAAVRTAQAAASGRRVLNSYNFGGYLIFAGIPPYIDGRADLYGDDFVADYGRAIKLEAPERLMELLKHHDIGWTLFAPSLPAVALLDRLPGWQRIYADETAVVHVRLH